MRPQRSISQLDRQQRLVRRLRIRNEPRELRRRAGLGRAARGRPSRRSRPAGTVPDRVCVSTPTAVLDVGGGDLDVEVVRERLRDERVEHRVVELLPPLRVRGVGGVLRRVDERRRRVDRGARVVGADHAAAEHQQRSEGERARARQSPSARGAGAAGGAAGACSGASSGVPAASRLAALLQPVEDVEEERHVEHRERRLAEHAADDAGADRMARVGAGADGERQRQAADRERERRHDDRPQALLAGEDRRLHDRLALLAEVDRRGHAQHGVLGAEADQHEEADLEIDVVVEPAQVVGEQRAEDAERHRGHHGAGQRPRLVLRREHEEHDDEAEHERERPTCRPTASPRTRGPTTRTCSPAAALRAATASIVAIASPEL